MRRAGMAAAEPREPGMSLLHGVAIFPTEYSMSPAETAAAAEERGFESFWVPEHSHFPVSPITPGPGQTPWPSREYYHVMDPFVSLAMAAQATRRIRLGTGICLVVQRDPIQLAKQVASLDVLSGGRFELGVGGGWHPLEIANHGIPFDRRLAVMRERLEAMRAIWTEEQAEYHGEHVEFGPMYAWPKPLQKPHPRIHVAASAPKGLRRVVRDGDAWFPMLREGHEQEVLGHLPALRDAVAASGRDPGEFPVSIFACPSSEKTLALCREAGVTRVIYTLPSEPRDGVLRALDGLRRLLEPDR